MTQTSNRLLDEFAKLMTEAAGAAQGASREVQTLLRSQGERVLRELDVVQREEFEMVKALAEKARTETLAMEARVARLEAAIAAMAHPDRSPAQSLPTQLFPSGPSSANA